MWGYTDIPVTLDTTVYTEMSPTTTEYTLEIDHDGDSIVDETVTPNLGVSLSSPNAVQPLRLNTTLQYEIELTNEGDQEETFTVDCELPNEWTGSLSQSTVTVGPKETKTVTLSVNVPNVEIKDYEMRVTASSEEGLNTSLTLLASAQPELTVSNLSVDYGEGKEVLLSCNASNFGLLNADNVTVQFYNGKPENNNLIGEKVISLASGEIKHVAIPWSTEDGIYTIYAVIDPDDTISETAEYNNTIFNQFTIDRTPPEANIKFNTETQDIKVTGVDNLDDDVDVSYEEYNEKGKLYRVYELKDDTGNVLTMEMEYKKRPNTLDIEVLELTYNREVTVPQKNKFHIVSVYKEEKLKNLVQHLKVAKDNVRVKYNPKKDESIITNDGMEKRDGPVLIVLSTEKGTLSYMLE